MSDTTKKIRFTKDGFFGIKAGDEHDVNPMNSHRGKAIIVKAEICPGDNQSITIPLVDLEGFYEVVRWEPEDGENFHFVNTSDGEIYISTLTCVSGSTLHRRFYEQGNCFPLTSDGYNEAKAVAKKIRALFEEGV